MPDDFWNRDPEEQPAAQPAAVSRRPAEPVKSAPLPGAELVQEIFPGRIVSRQERMAVTVAGDDAEPEDVPVD